MHQSNCLNIQRSLAVVAALFVSVLWYCAHRCAGSKVVLGKEIFVSKLDVPVSRQENGTGPEVILAGKLWVPV